MLETDADVLSHFGSIYILIPVRLRIAKASLISGGSRATLSLRTNHRFSTTTLQGIQMKRSIDEEKKGEESPSKRHASSSSSAAAVKAAANTTKSLPLPLPFLPEHFNSKRARMISDYNNLPSDGKCVVYWMSRDQRAEDNYALLYAQALAIEKKVPLKVVFNLVPKFLEATVRQYGFMIKGLEQTERHLRAKNIPFYLLSGDPQQNIAAFATENQAYCLVVDFSPVRMQLSWVGGVKAKLAAEGGGSVPFVQIDAHNVVPCWYASDKLEYGARTIRPKINNKIPEFLVDIPPLQAMAESPDLAQCAGVDWRAALDSLDINREVKEVDWLPPGPEGAQSTLEEFVKNRIGKYSDDRNDPNKDVASNLSPYLHFGQISMQRAALYVKREKKGGSSVDSFLEESIVRRELADNFCFYNPRYDDLSSCYEWAKETLRIHTADPRSVLYSQQELEAARTHDELWNAAQLQMTSTGKMHGFLRMYWAKKILEWTPSPQEALRIALFLNDKYELDGRDPNGYVGCMWSIGGIHDQGWAERAVFGKIRYMNFAGCKRKFDVTAFVKKYPPAEKNAAEMTKKHPKAIK